MRSKLGYWWRVVGVHLHSSSWLRKSRRRRPPGFSAVGQPDRRIGRCRGCVIVLVGGPQRGLNSTDTLSQLNSGAAPGLEVRSPQRPSSDENHDSRSRSPQGLLASRGRPSRLYSASDGLHTKRRNELPRLRHLPSADGASLSFPPFTKVQFQKGLSEAQFAVLYGTEDQ